MIARFTDASIMRNRGIVVAAAVALVVLGVYSLYTLRRDAMPGLSDIQVIVFTESPGAQMRRTCRDRDPASRGTNEIVAPRDPATRHAPPPVARA